MTSPGGGNVVTIRVVTEDKSAPGFAAAQRNVTQTAKAAAGLGTELDRTATKAKGLGGVLRDIGTVAAGVLVADTLQAGARKVIAFAQSSVKAASDLGESVNAVSKVFDNQTDRVLEWGKANANAIGLSTRAFNQLATPLGAMLKNSGLAMDDVADHTIKLTERAADMASVFNVDVSEALTAIQAGLRGEADPLERFGVSLSAAAVESRALADTGKANASQLTAQEKALARLNILYDQTNDTAGDFRDTSDGLANSQRIATAQMEDAKAKIGAAFIPVMAKAAQVTGKVAEAFSAMSGTTQLVTAAVVAIGAAMVILAPKILAAKQALDAMAASDSKLQQGMGKTAKVAAAVGTAFVAIQLAGMALDALFGDKLAPDVDAAAVGLKRFAEGGKLTGEAARTLGKDLEDLRNIFHRALGRDGSLIKDIGAEDTLRELDQVLAHMVSSGNAAAAAKLLQMLVDPFLSLDQIKSKLPGYAAELEKTIAKTKDTAEATVEATKEISTAWQDAHAEFIDIEGAYETALDKMADKQKLTTQDLIKALQDQVKAQEDWADNMIRLAIRVPTTMLDELRAMGPKGAALVALMATMTDKELAKVVQLWKRGGAAAGQGFADELKKKIAPIVAAAQRLAQAAADAFNRVFHGHAVLSPGTPSGAHQSGGFAHGGIVGAAAGGGPRGGFVDVGEHGWERVKLPYGSTVYSHGDSERMAGAGGGGQINVTLTVVGGQDEFDRFMAKWLRKFVQVTGGGDVQVAFT